MSLFLFVVFHFSAHARAIDLLFYVMNVNLVCSCWQSTKKKHSNTFVCDKVLCVKFSYWCVSKGTQIYDAKKGSFVDLGILDVMQIFGRAGRPQYDTFGHGTIITTHNKLSHYLSLLTQQNPIESQFMNSLEDNLNAEVLALMCKI